MKHTISEEKDRFTKRGCVVSYIKQRTLPDYEEGGDTVVADGCEPHAERLDLSGQQQEVVHKGSG